MSPLIIKILKRYSRVYLPLVMILLCISVAILAPWIAPDNPLKMHAGSELLAPGSNYPLGTDEYGRDLLSRLIYGTRVSTGIAFAAVSMALILGLIVGMVSGIFGGLVDDIIMRAMDVIFAFPPILLALAIVAFFGAGAKNTIIAITIVYLPRFARVIRASVLTVKASEYVTAARALGASNLRVALRHILPNIRSVIMVQTSLSLSTAILFEASLSFLGLGIQPPIPSWGRMLSEARSYMVFSPWASIFPGLAIVFLILGFNMLGDRLRDVLDPKLRH